MINVLNSCSEVLYLGDIDEEGYKIYNVLKPEFDTLGIAGATPENLAKVADLMKKNREGKK